VHRTIPAVLTAAALLLGGTLATIPADIAVAAPVGGVVYYSNPFDDRLVAVRPADTSLEYSGASYEEWRADGFPAPVPARVTYIGYTWDSTIWADQAFGRFTYTTMLDFDRWTRAGQPAPRSDVLADSHDVIRYDGSDELFVILGATYTDEPGFYKLSFAEFARLGYPAVDRVEQTTFRKLPWNPAIIGPKDRTGDIGVMSFEAWDYFSRPTPQIVRSFDGDRFCQAAGSADIRYVGIAAPQGMKLSYAQWRDAGFPAPTRC
jgi:hypothetical protein